MIQIRQLTVSEYDDALALALEVFIHCGRSDYNAEGIDTFKRFVDDPGRQKELSISGAFYGGELIGMIGIRCQDAHISLFFIRPEFHRKGVGKMLFDFVFSQKPVQEITVSSSTSAVPFYESLGFTKMADVQVSNGLVSVPMKRLLPELHVRRWQESDIASLARYLNNRKIWDNCRDSLPFPYTEKDACSFIHYALIRREQQEFCIDVNGEAVGNISFIRGTDVDRYNAEVGYWLAEPFWNRGLMTKALRQTIAYYLEHTDVVRLFAMVYETNRASMRILEKLGFRMVGIHRKACFKNERFLDTYYYELLKEDFFSSMYA